MAPYVPTGPKTVRRMLKIVAVGPDDVVYDLGCGDGRVLITAVVDFGAKRAVGYEVRGQVYKYAFRKVESRGLWDRVRLVNGDLFEADVSDATVIILYLNGSTNQLLKPKLEREVRDGTRVVTYTFKINGWKPSKEERIGGDSICLYTLPEALAVEEDKNIE